MSTTITRMTTPSTPPSRIAIGIDTSPSGTRTRIRRTAIINTRTDGRSGASCALVRRLVGYVDAYLGDDLTLNALLSPRIEAPRQSARRGASDELAGSPRYLGGSGSSDLQTFEPGRRSRRHGNPEATSPSLRRKRSRER